MKTYTIIDLDNMLDKLYNKLSESSRCFLFSMLWYDFSDSPFKQIYKETAVKNGYSKKTSINRIPQFSIICKILMLNELIKLNNITFNLRKLFKQIKKVISIDNKPAYIKYLIELKCYKFQRIEIER